jgi:hypothetical protein
MKERNIRGSIRIVFDRGNSSGNFDFVPSKVDLPILSPMATTTMIGGDAAIRVSTT